MSEQIIKPSARQEEIVHQLALGNLQITPDMMQEVAEATQVFYAYQASFPEVRAGDLIAGLINEAKSTEPSHVLDSERRSGE